MLRKVISIKNVGRFHNSAASGNPELARHTLISGANGFGKTTLCAVLRSLKTGDPAHILGRRTLGVEDPPIVELLFPGGRRRFDGAAWSDSYPDLAIFDSIFIAENVHSGEVVGIDHRRNLYRVIIGEEGVRLAEEDAGLARQSREKTGEITAAGRAIQPYLPPGMNLDAFMALAADPEIDARITEQERTVQAVCQAHQINERPPLSEIALPAPPDDFAALLASTIDDIAQDAETRLAEHFAERGMDANGGNWIAEGLEHADGETCPFCGQDIHGLPLIAAYRAVFSDRYKALRDDIAAMRNRIAQEFGDGAIARLNTRVEQNKGAMEFWGRFCAFDPAQIQFPDEIPESTLALGQAAVALLDRKARSPLEPIEPDETFDTAAATYQDAQERAREIAEAVRAVNDLIATKKEETGTADVQAAEAELTRLRAVKARHTDSVSGLCADHGRLTNEKQTIESRKADVRTQLDTHTLRVMRPYEQRINHYLDAFNAGFTITECPSENILSHWNHL